MSAFPKFQFAIDRGGTFTDVYARCPSGRVRLMKLLSEDPANYADAPREGIRRILEQETGRPFPADEKMDASEIECIRMGTTVATNALLERRGEPTALVVTAGFRDLLYIGNQSRPNLFDLTCAQPEVLYDQVVEAEERVVLCRSDCQLDLPSARCQGTTGETVSVVKPLNVPKLRADLERVLAKGIGSLAVALLHSYTFQEHERLVGEVALELGFRHVSLSSQVMPMVRVVPRGFTACVDAYLTPCIKKYVEGFTRGFQENLKDVAVLFMQSDGGLTPMHMFSGSRSILSGPAGGVVGYAKTSYSPLDRVPVIGFDMGGTSTDVSRFDGHFDHTFETTTAGVTIQAPQLDISTVAAGGGSMLFFRSGLFVVGPESAGAHPGPVCYRKGGPLTVTDANVCLGRLLPDHFPKIFGKNEREPLDKAAAMEALRKLTAQVNSCLGGSMTPEQVAMGFVSVANESMCRPIRALTQGKGHDSANHVLACFGGAGAQHACAVARALGMTKVLIHRYAGILSAYGMALADVVEEAQEPCALLYTSGNIGQIDARLKELSERCIDRLLDQGFKREQIEVEPFLHMRYDRTDCALMCPPEVSGGSPDPRASGDVVSSFGNFQGSFQSRYKREFGFVLRGRDIVVDDVRVRAVGRSCLTHSHQLPRAEGDPQPTEETQCYFEDRYYTTPVFLLNKLLAGHVVQGPAIVIDDNCTIVVEPGCHAQVLEQGDVCITVNQPAREKIGLELDAVRLSLFSHRFMSIAEQMGKILQRTAISTNIKERLDFSCALFGPDGGLVCNAPHIPVHLGAMQEAVQYQMKALGENILPGDVILSNHPQAGGSHLPDLTVITPVFYPGEPRPVFFVANRGHHADIGGISPGSMPAHSHSILEEGATFLSFKLVQAGVFQQEALTEALNAPALLPNSSGTRNLRDNLADLQAQIAANNKGIQLVRELIDHYGLAAVQAYMGHVQRNAELAVRDLLRGVAAGAREKLGRAQLEAWDCMDDGSRICLRVQLKEDEGSAVFDFSGTGREVYGNCNAPRAVTLSAILYCLRCMVGHDIPLNQGCLAPVQVVLPRHSLLNPSADAAVVGGNVLTSQRVVDVVFKAFGTCAASQGCMNNITFGDDSLGYYETVAGGAGAGPDWHGRSGVHTHMTNTRITDPEILERSKRKTERRSAEKPLLTATWLGSSKPGSRSVSSCSVGVTWLTGHVCNASCEEVLSVSWSLHLLCSLTRGDAMHAHLRPPLEEAPAIMLQVLSAL
ncbi:5-oxoprolinase isoform X2 [Ixodes scapularis]|uniref:5-oxoprolinase isoform X2 n=1 Tax=Ixodes scapularis TaxID=6945 RepID=UPI001C381726|nr:5-oxoprolinase isoform X2 [Ixodes scapularis]